MEKQTLSRHLWNTDKNVLNIQLDKQYVNSWKTESVIQMLVTLLLLLPLAVTTGTSFSDIL